MMKLSHTLSAFLLIAITQAEYIPVPLQNRTKIPDEIGLAEQLDIFQSPPIDAASAKKCPIENLLSACGTLREDNSVPKGCECATFCGGEYLGCASFGQEVYGIGCSGVLIAGCQTSASAADESSSEDSPIVPASSLSSDEDEDDSERAHILIGGVEDEHISSSTLISSRISFLLLAASAGALFL